MGAWRSYRFKLVVGGIVVVALAALLFLVPGMDREKVLETVNHLPTTAFIIAFIVLPLAGAPISLFLIVAGIKFGLVHGLLVAAGCMLIHNIVAYWFTHSFIKRRIIAFLDKIGYKIPHVPEQHHVWFTAAFAGIPGIPYTPKLYLLALTNIPFRIYFWIGWPVYSLSNVVYLGLAGAAVDLNWKWIALFLSLGLATLAFSYWLKKRLDRRLRIENNPEPVEQPR